MQTARTAFLTRFIAGTETGRVPRSFLVRTESILRESIRRRDIHSCRVLSSLEVYSEFVRRATIKDIQRHGWAEGGAAAAYGHRQGHYYSPLQPRKGLVSLLIQDHTAGRIRLRTERF